MNEVQKVLSTYNISLNQAKTNFNAGRKNEEVKTKKKIEKECKTLFLTKNKLLNIAGLYDILGVVMWNHDQLKWIDLSYNKLVKIEPEILKFKQLKTLYYHGNYIYEMAEVQKL